MLSDFPKNMICKGETQLERLITTLMEDTPRRCRAIGCKFAKLADQDPDKPDVQFMRTLQAIDRELARESDALAMAGEQGKEALLNRQW